MVRDCGVEVVVTESKHLPLVLRMAEGSGCLRKVVCLDEPAEIPPVPPGAHPGSTGFSVETPIGRGAASRVAGLRDLHVGIDRQA